MTGEIEAAWSAFVASAFRFYTTAPGARPGAGERWFAAVSGLAHGELNVCGLTPGAAHEDATALCDHLGDDLHVVAFVSERADDGVRTELVRRGLAFAADVEPLMTCRTRPVATAGPYEVRTAGPDEVGSFVVALMSEAHRIPAAMVEAVTGPLAAGGLATAWVALRDDVPVSVVWLLRVGSCLVVNSMMTPERYQRQGAGRALLSTALATEWDGGVDRSVLLSSVAGTALYRSLGYAVTDAVTTAYRGLDDADLAAIGARPA